jgi:hypothetical protein
LYANTDETAPQVFRYSGSSSVLIAVEWLSERNTMSTLRLSHSFQSAATSICLLLSPFWISSPAFGATPNPQRVGEVKGESLLYVAENEFRMRERATTGGVTIYRYSASGVELRESTITGKSVTGRALTGIVSVGEYLVARHDDLSFFDPAATTSEFSVWSRAGALIANVSLANGVSFEQRQFAIEGNTLILLRSNQSVEPLERLDLVTLHDGKSKSLATFPTRSRFFSLANGVVSIVREELEGGNVVPYVHNYGLDGKRFASINLARFIPNGSGGLGTIAKPIEPDPKVLGNLEFYLEWDFLRKIITLDRTTLSLKSEENIGLYTGPFDGGLVRRGALIVNNFSFFTGRGGTIRSLFVKDQAIEVIGGFSGEVLISSVLTAFQVVKECVEFVNDGMRNICVKQANPVVFRYDLQGDASPNITFVGEREKTRLFGVSAGNSGPRFLGFSPRIRHVSASQVEIPIVFENVGTSPAVSSSSYSYGGTETVQNRWRYDSAKKVLIGAALPDGTTEVVTIRVSTGGKEWSFDPFQVLYETSPPTTTPLVEFFNTNLGHFFITFEGPESQSIDEGRAGPGWMRTGYSWAAWNDAALAPPEAKGVCRFYGNPALDRSGKRLGPNSHFYTIDPDECARVAKDPGWILESKTAFYALAPDPVYLGCSNSTAVRRWYNDGFPAKDSNHRYSSSYDDSMERIKWSNEGVRFCLPSL